MTGPQLADSLGTTIFTVHKLEGAGLLFPVRRRPGRRNLGGKWEYSAIDLLRARVALHLAKQDRGSGRGHGSVLPAWPPLERVDAAVLALWRSKERNGAGGSSGSGASL